MAQSADPVILAVDLGTSGVKVALITVFGRVLGWESQPVAWGEPSMRVASNMPPR